MAICLEHTAEQATVQFSLMASYLHEYFHLARFVVYAKLYVNSSKLPNHQWKKYQSVLSVFVCQFVSMKNLLHGEKKVRQHRVVTLTGANVNVYITNHSTRIRRQTHRFIDSLHTIYSSTKSVIGYMDKKPPLQ